MRNIDRMYSLYGMENGKKCCGCKHFMRYINRDKTYFKCAIYGSSSCASSDFRVSYDACGMYNKDRDKKHDRPVKDIRMRKNDNDDIDGQMNLSDFGI